MGNLDSASTNWSAGWSEQQRRLVEAYICDAIANDDGDCQEILLFLGIHKGWSVS